MANRLYRRRIDPDFDAYNKRLGQRVRELRIARELDQDSLAMKANLHRSHVSLIENARSDPTTGTLFKVAKALDITLSELLSTLD